MSAEPAAPARSYLYAPAHKPALLTKALASDTDAVVIDLEDAVPIELKSAARDGAADALARAPRRDVWVRVNAVASGFIEDDVAAVASPHLAGVRVPKVQSAQEARRVGELLARAGCEAAVHCLIESALGLERIGEIARADRSVQGIGLGETDLAADLGAESDAGLAFARGRCVIAARAAGLAAPVQSVFTDTLALEELRASSEAGRALGFFGRSAIHPRQLEVINDVYTPSRTRVNEAQALVEQLERAQADGAAAFALPNGRFVDRAVVEQARRTLALSERLSRGASG